MSEGWSGRRGSNPRPTAWKAVTLPLSYSRLRARRLACHRALATSRYGGASPPLPFNQLVPANAPLASGATRSVACRPNKRGRILPPTFIPPARPTFARVLACRKVGGEGRVRTSVGRSRQVYSLLRLTALPPPRNTSRAALQGTIALGLSACIL